MNNYMSGWNLDDDLTINGQKNQTGADHDLVELLWRNGQVVLHSQTHRKQALNNLSEPVSQVLSMAPDDETVSWIHYPVEDSFEKELCSNFFLESPSCDPMDSNEPMTRRAEEENQMPPPKVVNLKCDLGLARECSVMTVGLSHCGSNQPANDPDVSWVSCNTGLSALIALKGDLDCEKVVPRTESGGKAETVEPTLTNSSGGSGSSFGRTGKQGTTTTTTRGNTHNKRKSRETEELECQSEDAELEYKSSQRSGTSRKSRAAEVHNLSERKRRDRINEKMKALQELIPHSNKTDKASMLDEAIEYLKSLQLQLQVMWMGNGMTPMMFPGIQHYMSRMGMAMGPPSIPSAMHLPHQVPLVDHQSMNVAPTLDQSVLCQTQAFMNPLNYQTHQMQNASVTEQYARFMGFHPAQTVSQRLIPQTAKQQSPLIAQQDVSSGLSSGGAPINGGLSAKNMGKSHFNH